jgi:hypothetical protein
LSTEISAVFDIADDDNSVLVLLSSAGTITGGPRAGEPANVESIDLTIPLLVVLVVFPAADTGAEHRRLDGPIETLVSSVEPTATTGNLTVSATLVNVFSRKANSLSSLEHACFIDVKSESRLTSTEALPCFSEHAFLLFAQERSFDAGSPVELFGTDLEDSIPDANSLAVGSDKHAGCLLVIENSVSNVGAVFDFAALPNE